MVNYNTKKEVEGESKEGHGDRMQKDMDEKRWSWRITTPIKALSENSYD